MESQTAPRLSYLFGCIQIYRLLDLWLFFDHDISKLGESFPTCSFQSWRLPCFKIMCLEQSGQAVKVASGQTSVSPQDLYVISKLTKSFLILWTYSCNSNSIGLISHHMAISDSLNERNDLSAYFPKKTPVIYFKYIQ